MNVAVSSDERRRPCPKCGTLILEGARKCRGCRTWLAPPPSRPVRVTRSLTLVVSAVVAVLAILVT